MWRRPLATLLAAALVIASCGGDEETLEAPVRFASLAELTGPWRAIPLTLDPVVRERAAAGCRRDMELPAATVAAIIDARGAGVVTVRMTGAGAGRCEALEITSRGEVFGAGGGWSGNQEPMAGEPLPTKLGDVEHGSVGGGNLHVQGFSVLGRAGAAIAVVEVVMADGESIAATVENGWFSAWWPAQIPNQHFGFDPFPDVLIRAFDASGVQLDQVQHGPLSP